MSDLTLVIGNKNYSSWSLRPWILMKHLGLEFQELLIPLYQPGAREELDKHCPGGKVPVLHQSGLRVWESLAICDHVAELAGRGWPKHLEARGMARSICAEMHAGFFELRNAWPMNSRARNRRVPITPRVQADVDRVEKIWSECRSRFGASGGPWLFGEYSVADAMFAPVVLRFNTYGEGFSDNTRAYMTTVIEDPPMQEWMKAGEKEPWKIAGSDVG
jgi:glutathione S-transferase